MNAADSQLATRHCLTLECQVGKPFDAGDPGGGVRRCIPLMGGRFYGDLEGELVPGGSDWQTILPNGTIELSAHYALRTNTGAVIEVSSIGLRHASPEVMERLNRREAVAADQYYFRTHMRWRTGAPELARWNTRLLVSRGERQASIVRLEIFEIA
jgi:Protein of unknown function (DUF3237)